MTRNSIRKKAKGGFALMELLIVISIIGILASIVLLSLKIMEEKARIVNLFQFSRTLKRSLWLDAKGEYQFENNLNDSSGNGNDAFNIIGSVSYVDNDLFPELGKALSVVPGSFIEISKADVYKWDIKDKLTIETLIKTDDPIESTAFEVIRMPGNIYFAYWIGNLQFNFKKTDNTSFDLTCLDNNQYKRGKWNHVVATYNGSDVKLYLNGRELCSGQTSGDIDTDSLFDTKIGFGTGGQIDELRIYNREMLD